MDIRDLTFDSGAFDVAIDKGGEHQVVSLLLILLTPTRRDDGRDDDRKGRRLGCYLLH